MSVYFLRGLPAPSNGVELDTRKTNLFAPPPWAVKLTTVRALRCATGSAGRKVSSGTTSRQ